MMPYAVGVQRAVWREAFETHPAGLLAGSTHPAGHRAGSTRPAWYRAGMNEDMSANFHTKLIMAYII